MYYVTCTSVKSMYAQQITALSQLDTISPLGHLFQLVIDEISVGNIRSSNYGQLKCIFTLYIMAELVSTVQKQLSQLQHSPNYGLFPELRSHIFQEQKGRQQSPNAAQQLRRQNRAALPISRQSKEQQWDMKVRAICFACPSDLVG